jgi:hypothetical protein
VESFHNTFLCWLIYFSNRKFGCHCVSLWSSYSTSSSGCIWVNHGHTFVSLFSTFSVSSMHNLNSIFIFNVSQSFSGESDSNCSYVSFSWSFCWDMV